MRNHTWLSGKVVVLGVTMVGSAWATPLTERSAAEEAPLERRDSTTWHARLGAGLHPVFTPQRHFPRVKGGFGAALSGFVQLPHRLSAGAGFDWEQYHFDSVNSGDLPTDQPRYVDQTLTHTRIQALLQWDILTRNTLTPFLLVAAGYGWEGADLTSWQCHPRSISGAVLGTGAGLDVSLGSSLTVGAEYRFNTWPLSSSLCTGVLIPDEPLGPPRNFSSHRFGVTFGVRR